MPDTPSPASEAGVGEADLKLAPEGPAQDAARQTQLIPQTLRESPESTWYVRPPSGGQFGPASSDIFWGWMTDNRVAHDALVWKDGWPEWLVASQVFEDYFGSDVAEIPGSQANLPSTASDRTSGSSTAQEASTAQPTLSERNRILRKQRRKRNYMIMLAVLSVLSVVLIIALIVVLMMQD